MAAFKRPKGPLPLPRDGHRLPVDRAEVQQANTILQKYKDGKANLESRIVNDELWYEMRHWEILRNKTTSPGKGGIQSEPASAWLFNAIVNKHADACDNFPEPVVLPREPSDEKAAKILSSVLPVVLENADFEEVYADNWWEKLKHGTAAYGVFWDSNKENGLGEIDIRPIDLLKLFWEPGVTDIQQSRNLFITELVDTELLEDRYPDLKGKLSGSSIDLKQYLYDDTVDISEKSLVVDWYYKKRVDSGNVLLHYAKFVGDTLLFASENDPRHRDRGWYDHGLYPVVLDVMFPEKGTPVGFGYVSVCREPQMYIDKLSGNVLENAVMTTKKRFFVSSSTGINEEEFLDWSRPIVHVEGDLSESRIREIATTPLSGIYLSVINQKIEEMKDTASNRDVNSGGTTSGVTAASAIAALQEAGNKVSRDLISASYRSYRAVCSLCIELMRQFYTETRAFRITGETGEYEFVEMNNQGLTDQPLGTDSSGETLFRRPVFDLKIMAQKKNPFSRMEQNERAKELYALGFFNPDRAQEALAALDMMSFEGIEKVREHILEGNRMTQMIRQLIEQNRQLLSLVGGAPAAAAMRAPAVEGAPETQAAASSPVTRGAMDAMTPQPGYAERLARNSTPEMPQ